MHIPKQFLSVLICKIKIFCQFDGEGGKIFKEECASYCENQSAALSFIKEKSKKDQSFKHFLQVGGSLDID